MVTLLPDVAEGDERARWFAGSKLPGKVGEPSIEEAQFFDATANLEPLAGDGGGELRGDLVAAASGAEASEFRRLFQREVELSEAEEQSEALCVRLVVLAIPVVFAFGARDQPAPLVEADRVGCRPQLPGEGGDVHEGKVEVRASLRSTSDGRSVAPG